MGNKNEVVVNGQKLVYCEPIEYSKNEIEKIINSGDQVQIGEALFSLGLYSNDLDFASKIIFSFAQDKDYRIRATALLCIGYLVMNHGKLPASPTIELLQKGVDDPNIDVKDSAFTAAHEIDLKMPEIGKMIKRDFKSFYGFDVDEFAFDDEDE